MALSQATSTSCVTTKRRHLFLSRTQAGMCLVALLQYLGQVLLPVLGNKHQAPSSSPSQICTESSPQSFPSKTRMMTMLFVLALTMGQHLGLDMILYYIKIATQEHLLAQILEALTMILQEKETAFSQVAQVPTTSKCRTMKCLKLVKCNLKKNMFHLLQAFKCNLINLLLYD